MPAAKDIYYFDQYYQRGMSWYESFFKDAGEAIAIGEVSHDYLYSSDALHRIRSELGDVKLVMCLRDPIQRAHSAYLFMKRNGTTKQGFRDTLLENPNILERGLYSRYVEESRELFGAERVKVFIFDDLQYDPRQLAKELYRFIGVDDAFDYRKAEEKVLPASAARVQVFATIAKKGARLVRKLGYPGLVGRLKDSKLNALLYKPLERETDAISDSDQEWLRGYYENDVVALESLLGIRLPAWLKAAGARS